jgi:hypothetical protein
MALEKSTELVPDLLYFGSKFLVGSAATRHPVGEVTVGAVSYAG